MLLQFSFSRSADGDFTKKVVEAFSTRGGFDSYLRLVSATHLDTPHTVKEAAKATGQPVEKLLIVSQDEEKLQQRKFYKLTPQSAALTVKLDGKGIEADTAYGFNTIKGDQAMKKWQFNQLWTDLFDRQVPCLHKRYGAPTSCLVSHFFNVLRFAMQGLGWDPTQQLLWDYYAGAGLRLHQQ